MPLTPRPRTALLTAASALAARTVLAPQQLIAVAEAAVDPAVAVTAPAAAPTREQVPRFRVVPGVRLKAKPPSFVLPVAGYRLTGRFGASSSMWSSTHTGLDFAAPEGAEIRAVAAGEVVSVGYEDAYGNKTALRLVDGTVLWFAHQSTTTVSVGQHVAAGELIGYVGATGNVTGPHLHLEVRPGDGEPVDPLAWLAGHGVHA